jgi:primary-amine oxidase
VGTRVRVLSSVRGVRCVVDVESTVPELEIYVGDEVVRKFPYDPSNPYFETDSIE